MSKVPLYGPRRFARPAFVFMAVAFAAGVTIQIFIAGLAIFVNPVNWAGHADLGHILLPWPPLLLLLALVGRLPRSVKWQCAALVGLIFVQFYTPGMTRDLPWAAASHPVIAMVLFWASVRIATNAWRLASEPDLKSETEQVDKIIPVHTAIAETE